MRKKTNKSQAAHRRPWRLLRLAFVWVRKSGPFKQHLFVNLRLLPSYLKNFRCGDASGRLCYQEREFSFNDTPTFHFKIRRPTSFHFPHIPCFAPSIRFDDDEEMLMERCKALKQLESGYYDEEDDQNDELDSRCSSSILDLAMLGEEEEDADEQVIDSRAENFITEFRKQLKLQRQISYLK